MKISVPKFGVRIVSRKDLDALEELGWSFSKQVSSTSFEVKKGYTQWEQFEIRVRMLFNQIGFVDTIKDPNDFLYRELDCQIDVCGGIGKYFLVIDCTQSKRGKVSLKAKLKDAYSKKDRILAALRKKNKKYEHVVMAVCIDGEEVSHADKRESERLNVKIVDADFFRKCASYADTLGDSLKYQILKRLGVDDIRAEGVPYFQFPAVVMKSGSKILFNFCATPEDLIQLAYVHRVDRHDEEGYQRELKPNKLKNLNAFLCDDGYYANNLVMCFDTKEHVTFFDAAGRKASNPQVGAVGSIRVPRKYCSGELIDGQHRLFGYLDFSGNSEMAEELRARRLSDTLNVVAIEDPGENERSLLFVDINSNQTRVSVRDIWALMADIRPTTQVGYIANLIKSLNHDGPLKGKIHIPGTNASRGRAINIANIGKGIKDRNLLTPKTSADGCAWNVFDGDRNSDEYPSHPSKRVISSFNAYLSIVRESAIRDWHRQKDGFLLTNNGINVCLRVYAEMLRYLHDRRDRPTAAAIKKIMRNKLGDFIESKNHLKLRRSSSSEVGRGEIAKEICTYLGIRVTTSKPRAMAARV